MAPNRDQAPTSGGLTVDEVERMNPRERDESWRRGPPSRADAGLRKFGEQIGDATMCPRCDGAGVVMGRQSRWPEGRTYGTAVLLNVPIKCPVCRGEGLDPNVQHGGA